MKNTVEYLGARGRAVIMWHVVATACNIKLKVVSTLVLVRPIYVAENESSEMRVHKLYPLY